MAAPDMITGGTVLAINPTEGLSFSGAVATFQDSNATTPGADFNASVNWGDGTVSNASVSGNGTLTVSGSHIYGTAGNFNATVSLVQQVPVVGPLFQAQGGVHVNTNETLSGGTITIPTNPSLSPNAGQVFSGQVATFVASDASIPGSNFFATINWGDGSAPSQVPVTGVGNLSVSGTHTWMKDGTFTVTVTVTKLPPFDSPPVPFVATGSVPVNYTDLLSNTPLTFSPIAGQTFNGVVAIVSDANKLSPAGNFVASVSFGDATAAVPGVITGGNGMFFVYASHTYQAENTYPINVTMVETMPRSASAPMYFFTNSAVVQYGDFLNGSGVAFAATHGVAFTGTVASFTDANTFTSPGSFIAIIDWGDGTSSMGTVTSTAVMGNGGTLNIGGTHTYAAAGTFQVSVVAKKTTSASNPLYYTANPGTATVG